MGSEKVPTIQFDKNKPNQFVNQVASKIIFIFERELEKNIALENVAKLIHTNFNNKETLPSFFQLLDRFHESESEQSYLSLSWSALVLKDDREETYLKLIKMILNQAIEGHQKQDKKAFKVKETGVFYSGYAFSLGELFISLKNQDENFMNNVKNHYTYLIEEEMTLEHKEILKDARLSNKSQRKKKKSKTAMQGKKLFDDILDYIVQRGHYKSESLNQKNPKAYIQVLSDQLRDIRRNTTQRMMGHFASEKKKALHKALQSKTATAEEIISATNPFKSGLQHFREAKLYNYRYMKTEKIRLIAQIGPIVAGLVYLGSGLMEIIVISYFEATIVSSLMVISKVLCSKKLFKRFYPEDVVLKLEEDIECLTQVFKKTSYQQMTPFLVRQVKENENKKFLNFLPEYLRYIFSVIPDKNKIQMTQQDFSRCLNFLQSSIRKEQNGRQIEG